MRFRRVPPDSGSRVKWASARRRSGSTRPWPPESGPTGCWSAGPIESETQLAFAALGDVLEGVAGGAAVGAPGTAADVRSRSRCCAGRQKGLRRSSRAVALGLLGVLRSLAQPGPVVVAVDDVQWLDPPSASALEFVARRLGEEPIGFLVAQRREPGDDPRAGPRTSPVGRPFRAALGRTTRCRSAGSAASHGPRRPVQPCRAGAAARCLGGQSLLRPRDREKRAPGRGTADPWPAASGSRQSAPAGRRASCGALSVGPRRRAGRLGGPTGDGRARSGRRGRARQRRRLGRGRRGRRARGRRRAIALRPLAPGIRALRERDSRGAAQAARAPRDRPRRSGGTRRASRAGRRATRCDRGGRARRGRPAGTGPRRPGCGGDPLGTGSPVHPRRARRRCVPKRDRGRRVPLRGGRDGAGADAARGDRRRLAAWTDSCPCARPARLGSHAQGGFPRQRGAVRGGARRGGR